MPLTIQPKLLKEWIDQGKPVFLIDVRQPWEHDLVSLPGSQLFPLGELQSALGEIQPGPGAMLVVYCHHGIRSLSGAAILEQGGLSPAYSLSGGIDAWSREVDPAIPRYR
ncbi:MAG: hypothetical protein EXR99_05690 [Gemmataceae bacterium]|nr:hypothetical protein [Gemmataceae bacterium]